MTGDSRPTTRWWDAIAPGTPIELGFVRLDRVASAGEWDALPRGQAIARRTEYLRLVETLAEGFGAVMPLAWQGDGVMVFVPAGGDGHDLAATTAGVLAITLTERLILSGFTTRIAAHAGRVDFDSDTGKMADPEIDRVGHLERDCPPGAAALSEDVYLGLPTAHRDRCAYLGTTLRDGTVAYVFPPAAVKNRDESRFTRAADDLAPLERRFLRYTEGPDVRRLRYVGFRLRRPDPPSLDLLDVFTPLDVDERAPARAQLLPDEQAPEQLQSGEHVPVGAHTPPADPRVSLAALWFRPLRPAPAPRPFLDVLARARHLVVLGDPGSGKSTLLRWLAVGASLGRSTSRRRLGVDERLVPLLLPVGRLFELRAALATAGPGAPPSVLDVMVRYFGERNAADNPDALRRLLARRLEEGGCLVLLDGLDEVPSDARLDLTRWIETFATAYHENRFVITSRLFGHAGIDLPRATTVVLRPFTDDQVSTYLTAWHRAYRAWESHLSPEAAQLDRPAADAQAEQLVRVLRADARLEVLAANPLLLSAIALVHRAEGQLPTHRVQLYEILSRTLCETWDEARRLASGARSSIHRIEYEEEAIPILGRLALWMHEHHPAGAADEGEVRETIAAALIERLVDRREAEKAAVEFLRRAGEDLQILVPRGPGLFGFVHLTFQEFFAAAYLHAREIFEAESRQRWYDARWEEVILLGVGMLAIVQKRPAAASRFVTSTLDWTVPAYPFLGRILPKQVCLAGRCAADGPNLDAPAYEAVAGALVRLVVRDPYEASRERGRRVLAHTRDTRIGALLLDRLVEEFGEARDVGLRSNATEAIGALRSPRTLDLLTGALRHDPAAEVRERAALALGALADARAVPHLLDAFRDDAVAVRRSAAAALGPFVSGRLVATLIELLRAEDARLRAAAARALGVARAPESRGDLFAILEHDPDPDARASAAAALRHFGDSRSAAALIAALRTDRDDVVRMAAANSLEMPNDPAALPTLARILREDPSMGVRALAALTLGMSAFRNHGIPTLVAILNEDPDHLARFCAALALGALNEPRSFPALRKVLSDHESPSRLRMMAAKVVPLTGDRESSESLVRSLHEDPDSHVRAAAARGIGDLGNLQALPLLVQAFEGTSDDIVREGIVAALWKLSDVLPWVPDAQTTAA